MIMFSLFLSHCRSLYSFGESPGVSCLNVKTMVAHHLQENVHNLGWKFSFGSREECVLIEHSPEEPMVVKTGRRGRISFAQGLQR